jgi:hypothetical protein
MGYTPVLISIATIALSGVVSALVTYKLNLRKDQDIFMWQKAEELYRSFDRYSHHLGMYFFQYFPLLNGLVDYNQHLDEEIRLGKEAKNTKDALSEVELLTGIYFPALEEHLKNFLAVRTELHHFLRLHKEAYKANSITDTKTEWSRPFSKRLPRLEAAAEVFKKSIVAEAQKYKPAAKVRA